jgi:hypothetical protein
MLGRMTSCLDEIIGSFVNIPEVSRLFVVAGKAYFKFEVGEFEELTLEILSEEI